MYFFLLWLILSICAGIVGRNKVIGFWGALFLSLIISPLLVLFILLLSGTRKNPV